MIALLILFVFPGPSRTLATSVSNAEECPNAKIRSLLASELLPSCRAYELVSPAYKEGYPLGGSRLTAEGNRVMLSGLPNLASTPGEGESPLEAAVYIDQRTTTGWHLVPFNTSLTDYVGQLPIAYETTNEDSLWQQHTPTESALSRGLYRRTAQGDYELIGPLNSQPTNHENDNYIDTGPENEADPVAATSNYNHVVLFASNSKDFWSFDQTSGSGNSLYEYSGTNNLAPVLVGVIGPKGSQSLIGLCGTIPGGGSQGSEYNMISLSGETIFFTEEPEEECGKPAPSTYEIYARLHGSLQSSLPAETVAISESACTSECGEASGKNFEGASENGEKVFFTSTQKLTNNAVNGTFGGNAARGAGCSAVLTQLGTKGGCNLYEYNFGRQPGMRLKLIEGGEVQGVLGIAENGERIYFVTKDILGSIGNEFGQTAQLGGANVYEYNTRRHRTAFVATLSLQRDGTDWLRSHRRSAELAGSGGEFLLFTSSKEGLTPDDSTSATQLFEYDAVTQELVRVTQGEHGYASNGLTAQGISPESIARVASRLGSGSDFKAAYTSLNVSTDGKRIVFETKGQLSPRASSSESGCTSVYEYSSENAISNGTVALISDGRDIQPYADNEACGAEFQQIDATAENVLFSTSDPLIPEDTDGFQLDIYDARIDGGIANDSSSICYSSESCSEGDAVSSSSNSGATTEGAESQRNSGTLPLLTERGSNVSPKRSHKNFRNHPSNNRRSAVSTKSAKRCRNAKPKSQCRQRMPHRHKFARR
ncbi:MAG TPA: hypothetical protein VMU32_02315 [Solirubrobacteraceae bacterium]|nr:hypothetical protein [Solirubrobacteraceae bacterium]